MKHILSTLLALAALLFLPTLAHAVCTSPAGDEGDLRYDSTAKAMYFCDGTDWKAMKASVSNATVDNYSALPTTVGVANTGIGGAYGGYSGLITAVQAACGATYTPCSTINIELYAIENGAGAVPDGGNDVTALDASNKNCWGWTDNGSGTNRGKTYWLENRNTFVSTTDCGVATRFFCCNFD